MELNLKLIRGQGGLPPRQGLTSAGLPEYVSTGLNLEVQLECSKFSTLEILEFPENAVSLKSYLENMLNLQKSELGGLNGQTQSPQLRSNSLLTYYIRLAPNAWKFYSAIFDTSSKSATTLWTNSLKDNLVFTGNTPFFSKS